MSFVLDDSEAALPIFSDVCAHCKHWFRKPGRKCAAFPGGIPLPIWLGENDHSHHYDGDHGIRFTPVSDVVTVQPELLPSFSSAKQPRTRKRRFVIRASPAPYSQLRSRLWQYPQIREKTVEVKRTDYGFTEPQPFPSAKTEWVDKGVFGKGKSLKKSTVGK